MEPASPIDITDYDYPLPEGRIARFPLPERQMSKLLVYGGGRIETRRFFEIGSVLPPGAMLVFNDTRVIRARILMHKPTGARIELFCLEPHDPPDYERAFAARGSCRWSCIVGNLKKWKEGPLSIEFPCGGTLCTLRAWREGAPGREQIVRFEWDAPLTFGRLLETLGRIPIPPYLGRESEPIDDTRYQTVYARCEGSVAAPTAGLHFTPELMAALEEQGFGAERLTLHVGAGTFLPVKERDAALHPMHTEHFEVRRSTLLRLLDGTGPLIAVGTTSVRTLESLPCLSRRIELQGEPDADRPVGQWEPYELPADYTGRAALRTLTEYMQRRGLERLQASTRIMIAPCGFRFRLVEGMVTNFHQPRSTLLLLVAALVGEEWRRIYDYALQHDFRFLSYGDSSLLLGPDAAPAAQGAGAPLSKRHEQPR